MAWMNSVFAGRARDFGFRIEASKTLPISLAMSVYHIYVKAQQTRNASSWNLKFWFKNWTKPTGILYEVTPKGFWE